MDVDSVGWTGNILTLDDSGYIVASFSWQLDYTPVHGQILGNYEDGATRKSQTTTIPANGTSQVVFTTEPFTITEENAPATSVDMPFRVIASLDGAQYDARPNVVAINVDTGGQVASVNLPAGTYYLQNSIQITNLASQQQTFKVELLPTYIYYSYDSASWKPTFDIWVKNIWQTQKKFTDVTVGDFKLYETDDQYASRVWDAILGNHLGDDAKVVFSSGRLSGHSDWEFTIAHRPVYDTSKTIDGVPSEWRITLYKSDAEVEATDKWLPSIMTQASAGDHFYFVGIEMPYQYVLWAEERLDQYKQEELDKVSDVDSTIVVQLDKVRLNRLQEGEINLLLNSVRVGNNIKVADSRFIASSRKVLHLQSVTYTWDASTIMLPNIEVVLSDDVVTSSNPIKNMQYRIDDTLKNVDAIRANSLAQISKAKKSIRDANATIKALSTGSLDVSYQVKALIGNDPWMSAREIAEDVVAKDVQSKLNPLEERVSAIEGDDEGKSMRAVAMEVLGDVNIEGDLSAFITQINSNTAKIETLVGSDKNTSARAIANDAISKKTTTLEDAATSQDDDGLVTAKDAIAYFGGKITDAISKEVTRADKAYASKKSLETTNDNIVDIDTRLGTAETNISNNSNLLSAHSQKITTLQTEQKSQKDTIQQQGATILALDLEVDGVKGDVLKANNAIEAIETELEDKADNSTVDSLSKDIVSTKAVVEIIYPQVNANADAIKSKASQEEVNALSESVTTLEGSVEEISNRVDNKADKGDIQTLVSQINNKVEQTTYNNKVAELEASIETNKDNIDNGIVYLEGYSERVANEAEARAKTYTNEEIAKVDTKADNALDKADKALADISELDASVKSSFDDIGATFDTLDSVITGINTTATNALTKATEVEAEVESNTKTIAEHTEIVTMLNNRCDSIEDTAEELESQISQIETNVTSLDEHIVEVEGKANNASAQASELAGIVTENTNKIDILVGTDNDTSVRAIANNAIDQKTILLEDAATSQDDDGLVTAKDAVTYFASKSYVNRIDGEIAGIEASMSDLEEDIKGVDTKADNALATANDAKNKANNNEANIERLGQDVKDVENTLSTLNTTINQVSKKADNAVSQAESATTKAEEAVSTAETASQNADKANNTITGVSNLVGNLRTTVEGNTSKIANIEGDVAENKAKIDAIEEDYISKGEAVDFATDLTGVVEATAEEFVYRPSAGKKSIRDKSAVIRRIKGNSVVWEQKLKSPSDENSNWQGYSSSMLTTEIQGREMRCTLTGASVATNPYQVGITGILPFGSVGGHKYLFCAWAKVSYLNKSLGTHFAFEHDKNSWTLYPAISEIDKWTFISRIWESPQNNNKTSTIRPPWSYTSANGAKAGDWYAIKDAMFFDLTAMFGEGNEPATVEDFRKVYNEAYYPYCQPELRGVKTGAIKTVGFNLFDGNCARVIGGMSYIVSNYAAAYYSETKNGAQTAVLIKDGVYMPECSGYLYLEGTADATPCVHFQHSGVMDGECAPYVEHILNLPEILKLFPTNGMHGLRNTYHDVYDEINIDNYIKRLEIVDLGSLWWNSDSSRQCFHAPLNTHKVRGIALCTRYTCTTLGSISDKQLSTHNYYGSDRIFIKDVDFDNPTDFMASLQGVYLVYELNEPIITPLSEPITLDYYCEDWGTEEAISSSSSGSAPFRADIVYQFNAEGRIRDNSRNIDKLEKIVTPLKNIPSNASLATQDFVYAHIPTRVATATERIKMYEGQSQLLKLSPNVMYDWTGGGSLLESITIPPLYINTETIGTYDHKWMVRVGSDTSDKVTIPFDVLWKDGIAPNWTSWCICEITFKCDAQQDEAMRKIIGEWKIYK
jgi:chromosome segregation ATPase